MGVTSSVFYYVECDQCAAHLGDDGYETSLFASEELAKETAADLGWQIYEPVLCSKCAFATTEGE